MLTAYVRHLIITYLANMVRGLNRRSAEAIGVVEWIGTNSDVLELDAVELGLPVEGLGSDSPPSDRLWRRLRKTIAAHARVANPPVPDLVARRLADLGRMIGLSAADIAIIEVILRYETNPIVEDFIDEVFSQGRQRSFGCTLNLKRAVVASLLRMSPNTFRRHFAADGPLIRSGLVHVDSDQDVSVTNRLRRLDYVVDDGADARGLLLGDSPESELEWSDFDHLGQRRDDVEHLLRGALDQGAQGVNILVYGPPGTGKTEFCRVLASRLELNLFSVGEADSGGDEPTRNERLAELRLAQNLLGRDRRAVLLFDEMEDLLLEGLGFPFGGYFGRERRSGSKVFMNRLLEKTPAPTLWTTNIAESINPAILRRMMFALEMRQPPPRIRSRIWSRQLAHHGIDATEEDAASLAREFDATPGVAAGATAAAHLSGGDFELVRRGVRSLSRVLNCEHACPRDQVCFDPALIEADLDVRDLADRLKATGQRRFSLCLQGPPGSGKSAYVRYLADRLDLEVMQKRTSDLEDMYVGETEKNIARAFAEARDNEAFLVFDEADSLLADRRGAHRNWEVSQVNEMLTWMESHPLPFACTTNYGERLDNASLRRFVFKATLDYLTPEAAATAFRLYFGLEPLASLGALDVLTPGDFEVVRRQAEVLDRLHDADALTAMLRAECEAKPGRAMAIGFGR